MTYSTKEAPARGAEFADIQLGYTFKRADLLQKALTHKSFSNEKRLGKLENNERLEFLGDAVLELCVTELLIQHFPSDPEGVLSSKRSQLVNEITLAKLAEELELHKVLQLGKGERQTNGHLKPRLLASALEALFGAIYLDGGFSVAQKYIKTVFEKTLQELEEVDSHKDYKTRLQELIQKEHRITPKYSLEKTEGPEHKKQFFVKVQVNGETLASGEGKSKKEAEQKAAEEAWKELLS